MHSIRRGAALLEPAAAVVVAVALALPWVLDDTGPWSLPGFAVLGMLAVAGILGFGGFRLPIAVLLRTALVVGALVMAASALPNRPVWLEAGFAIVAVVAALALPGRLGPVGAVMVAAGFGVAALAGAAPRSALIAAAGSLLLLALGLTTGWLARRADDPVPDPAAVPTDGEGLLGVAFETAAAGLVLIGPDGRVIRANQALGDMLGRSAEAMTGTSWWAHLGPEDASSQETRFKQLMAGEIWNFHIESRLRTRDRRLVGAVVGMSTISSAAGEPQMAFAQVVNINDRMRNEAKLRRRAAETRRNFDRAPVPMWEIGLAEIEPALERWRRDDTTDLMAHFERHPDMLRHTVSTLDIVDANEAAKRLVGVDGREEFVRGVRGGRLGPGFVEALGRHLDALWRGKTGDERVVDLQDFDGMVHSGMMRMTLVEAEDEEAAASMLVAFTDLAELLDGQQASGALDARLRAVVAAAPLVLFGTDASGLITLWEGSATRHTGHPAGEIVGRSVFEVFGSSGALVAGMRRAIDGVASTGDGTIAGHPYRIRYSPVFERGRVAGVIGLAADLSDGPPPPQREPEPEQADGAELPQAAPEPAVAANLEAAATLSDLLPEIEEAGEFESTESSANEPALEIAAADLDLSSLGDILGGIEEGEPVVDELLEIDPVELEALPTLDLPSIARVSTDAPDDLPAAAEPARPAIDLWEQVDRALEAVVPSKPVASNRNGSQAKAFGDAAAVQEILEGLIHNAEVHGGPQLTLRIDRLGDDLALSVIDNGPGLPSQIRSAVFGSEAAAGSELAVLRGRAISIGGELTFDYRRGHSIFTLSLPAV